MEKTIFKR